MNVNLNPEQSRTGSKQGNPVMKTGISPMRMSTQGNHVFITWNGFAVYIFISFYVFRSKILPVVEEGKSVFWGTILKAEERDWPFDVEVVDGDKVPLSVRIIWKINAKVLLKSNGPYLRPSKWSHNPVSCNEGCCENLILFCFGYWAPILDCGLWQSGICAE